MANEIKKISVPQFGERILVLGSERKAGEYEGNKYDNTYLYGLAYKVKESDDKIIVVNDTWKIKTENMKPIKFGCVIEATYDRNGKIKTFDILEQLYEGIEVHEV